MFSTSACFESLVGILASFEAVQLEQEHTSPSEALLHIVDKALMLHILYWVLEALKSPRH